VRKVLLSLDAGELTAETEALWELADLLHVACGGHAGDEASMRRVCAFCRSHPRVLLGAHPSYPDRAGFGRTSMELGEDALAAEIAEQCAQLESVARSLGVRVTHAKPHGALYHDARGEERIARAVLRGLTEALGWEVVVTGPPDGALAELARAWNLRYLREGFADRGYRSDGALVPRGEPGAIVSDPALAAEQAARLAASVDTLCVHGDGPNAIAVLRAVRARLHGGVA
jgi:UPF0271 protein